MSVFAGPLLFLGPFLAYLLSLAGSFAVDDSPETISAMAALEHQHPPGYPLFTMLGRLALLVPLGGPGFRAALLAAAGAALAVLLLARLARDLAGEAGSDRAESRTALAFTALFAVLSWTVWGQALSAKGAVYTLNASLLAGMMLLARRGFPLAFLGAVGLAHHWMSVLAGIPGVLALRGLRRPPFRAVLLAATLALLGCSAYLFLPVRSSTPLLLNWGRPERARAFYEVVSRAMYREVEGMRRPEGYWRLRVAHIGKWAGREMTPWLGWLAIPGLAFLWRRNRRGFWGLALMGGVPLFGALVVAHPLPNRYEVTEQYLVPTALAWAALSGIGLARLLRPLAGTARPWASSVLGVAALALVAHRGSVVSRSHDYVSYDYGINLLAGCPPGGVIFCEGDTDLFTLLYHRQVEGRRPDVAVVSAAFLDYPWYRETVHRQLPDMIPRESTLGEYVVKPVRPPVYTPQHPGGEGVLRPVGLVLRPPLGPGLAVSDSIRAWRGMRIRGIWAVPPGSDWLVRFLVGAYGLQMARLAVVEGADSGVARALPEWRRAVRLSIDRQDRGLRRYFLAQHLLTLREVPEAVRQAGIAAGEIPGYYRAWTLLANLDHIRGDDESAREHLRRALALLPPQEAERARVEGLLRSL